MVQAVSPHGPDRPLHTGPLPGAGRSSRNLFNAQASDSLAKPAPVDFVPISQQVTWCNVFGKGIGAHCIGSSRWLKYRTAAPIDFATPSRWSCCWRVCPSNMFPFCSGTRACELRRGITPRGSVRDKSNWRRMCARRGGRGRSRGHVQGTRENSGLYLADSKPKNLVLEGGVEPPQAIENTQLIDFIEEEQKRQKRPIRPIWARTGHTEKRPIRAARGPDGHALLLSSTLTPRISLFTSARRCARSSPPPTP